MKSYLFILYACALLPLSAKAQCSADFIFQQNLCSPKTISFSAVLPGVQTYLWDFGNGTTNNSTLNPVVNYSVYNNYTVSLTVTYSTGCTFTKTRIVPVTVQHDNSLISTPDSTICGGNSLQLNGTGPATNFCWHNSNGTLSTVNQDIVVSPNVSTVYYYTSQVQAGETVVNGDFSSGNTGFTTDYIYCNSFECISEGNYAIGNDAQFYHFDFRGRDHTTGTGNFMMGNGLLTANQNVWCQTVNVVPNTTYDFSMWICTVAGEYAPSQFQVKVNGVNVGGIAIAPSTINTWVQHTASWNSGSATTASLCILTTSDWFGGNDFGIDDISFGTPATTILSDSIIVNVGSEALIDAGTAPPTCRGTNLQLHAVTNTSDVLWSPAAFLDNPTSLNPTVQNLTATTMFYVETGIGACSNRDSVLVVIVEKPSVNISPDTSVCSGQSVVLQAAVVNASNFEWNPTGTLSSPDSNITVASPLITTEYSFIAGNGPCLDTSNVRVTVNAPQVNIIKSNDINCLQGTATLTASGAVQYKWLPESIITGGNTSNQLIVSPSQTTTYYAEGTDISGCKDTGKIEVVFYKTALGNVFIPNAFTPNGDSKNDIFKPIYSGPVGKYEFRVFDRWGNLVFFTDNPDKGWDGNFKSDIPLAGVYVYWMRLETDCGEEYIKGSVVLIR